MVTQLFVLGDMEGRSHRDDRKVSGQLLMDRMLKVALQYGMMLK